MTLQEYKKAIQTLNEWARHYYELDNPIASDSEYDALYRAVQDFERAHPQDIESNSPTLKVGGEILKDFSKNAHKKRMWSLEDVFDESDLKAWVEKLNNALKKLDSIESRQDKDSKEILESSTKNASLDSKNATNYSLFHIDTKLQNLDSKTQKSIDINNLKFCISPKYDGMSLNLYYKNGELVSATTRGDGEVGELVTQNAKMIESIPQRIAFKGEIEIRGEVVMRKDVFDALNKERQKNGEPLFANPRNAASGSMRQLDSNLVKERKLDFIPWGIGFCSDLESLKKMAKDRI